MVMIIDIKALGCELEELAKAIRWAVPDMVVHVMHEDIFNSMHRI